MLAVWAASEAGAAYPTTIRCGAAPADEASTAGAVNARVTSGTAHTRNPRAARERGRPRPPNSDGARGCRRAPVSGQGVTVLVGESCIFLR